MRAYSAIVGDDAIRHTDVQCFAAEGVFQRPVMEAKRYKILAHLFLPHDDATIWVDGNIRIKADGKTIREQLLGDADIAVFKHPYRATVWEEFATLKDDPRFAIPYLQNQLYEQRIAYRDAGLPVNAPLYECNVLIRRNNERVNRIMDAWWAEICRWQWRDQVSFPYVLWKHGADVKVAAMTPNAREHEYFDYVSQY